MSKLRLNAVQFLPADAERIVLALVGASEVCGRMALAWLDCGAVLLWGGIYDPPVRRLRQRGHQAGTDSQYWAYSRPN
jgi:hypothetical protein